MIHERKSSELIISEDKLRIFHDKSKSDLILSKVLEYYHKGWLKHFKTTSDRELYPR